MKLRQTEVVIRSGQPRPYADSEYVVQVSFEQASESAFEPFYMTEDSALSKLKKVNGYTTVRKDGRDDWFSSYLDYVKPIDPKPGSEVIPNGDPDIIVASTWEFRTVSPFTD